MPDVPDRLNTALAGRYVVASEIGRGGMATVFVAEDLKHHRKVALKVLHPELSVTLAGDRFLNEIEIVAGLEHPHILTLIDSGEADGLLYYIMPYVAGESLRQRLEREGQLPVEAAVRIAVEVADGLDFAHRQGVIHRDVKPGNILLSDKHAVITDFGIARAITVAQGERVTSTGLGVGTPLYASPEQAAGAEMLDGRTDIYSLGCMLYEMLSGEVPLMAATPQAVQARRMSETPNPLHPVRDSVPAALDDVIARTLAGVPADRYATAARLGEALHAFLSAATPEAIADMAAKPGAPGATPTAVAPELKRKVPRWWFLAAPLLLLAIWGVFTVGWQRFRGAPEEKLAELQSQLRDLSDRQAYDSAFVVAVQSLSGDARFEEIWNAFSAQVRLIRTDPLGAMVSRRPYGAPESWERLGATPISGLRLPLGLSVVRFELEGQVAVEMAVLPSSLDTVDVYLPEHGEVPGGMVRVPAGRAAIPNYSWADMELGVYLIDRYEVTNRQFKEFVDARGYDEPAFWNDQLIKESSRVERDEAIAVFVDRTGFPGPATWEAGDYPDGADDLPVQGVSWFEARAYAAFREKELPTAFHWHRAAQVELASYIVPMSNFGGVGPVPTGESFGLSGWGTYDMAGNVREWVANASDSERFILGGAWNDPTYLFPVAYAADPWDRSDTNGFRLASYSDRADLAEASQPLVLSYRDYDAEQPVSDETFEAFRSNYAYDPAPLDATVSNRHATEDWLVERVAFNAAYGDERVLADLYLPRRIPAPYQTVILMPGSSAITAGQTLDDVRDQFYFDFILKTGRAVLLPAYDGSLERRHPDLLTSRASETHAHAEYTAHWVKDLRRSVDYLESRQDIDPERIGYFGASWGGRVGAIMLAMEPRLRTGVLVLGGFRPERALPVADDLNFVPRVRQPVLMINGREDHLRPYERSQLPFFRLLGTAPEHKEHRVFPGGHYVPRADLIRETLLWLDRYLGPVEDDG